MYIYIHIRLHVENRDSADEQLLYVQDRNSIASCAMGWLWLVGSIKLQVSFAENRLFYRALLQKRPIILRSLQDTNSIASCAISRYY